MIQARTVIADVRVQSRDQHEGLVQQLFNALAIGLQACMTTRGGTAR